MGLSAPKPQESLWQCPKTPDTLQGDVSARQTGNGGEGAWKSPHILQDAPASEQRSLHKDSPCQVTAAAAPRAFSPQGNTSFSISVSSGLSPRKYFIT